VAIAFEANAGNSYDVSVIFSAADGGVSGSITLGYTANAGCGGQSTVNLTLPTSNGMNGSAFVVTINWDSVLTPHTRPGSSGTKCKPLTGTLTRNGVFHSNLVFRDDTLTGGWSQIVISGFTSRP
jgi:hypothetical protein